MPLRFLMIWTRIGKADEAKQQQKNLKRRRIDDLDGISSDNDNTRVLKCGLKPPLIGPFFRFALAVLMNLLCHSLMLFGSGTGVRPCASE
uniref:Uncharacterized protein n=1 Tax=Ditylenchus dipsaci TaxID=166011 RepID=A0A915EPX8_9BILA